MSASTPPTPAAVRCALAHPKFNDVTVEEAEALKSDPRASGEVLRDHIHAIAAEMRECANLHRDCGFPATGQDLSDFADKLEGKQNENT